jgi:hypothetical protein
MCPEEIPVFDELLRALRQLEGRQKIPVSIPADADGYLDRECPSAECLFGFKVLDEDWRDKVRNEEVFCPFCGHSADSGKWLTQEQVEHIRQTGIAHVQQHLGGAMRRDAERWNRIQPRNSFLKITMRVKSRPQQIPVPLAAAEPMRLKITCPQCSCRYAVIGAAFFCPSCGHNAAEQVFSLSLVGIRGAVDAIETVRGAISDVDTAETTIRLIVENGLQNAVTAFQRYAEALYARSSATTKARRNAFQSLTEGSQLWHAATGSEYSAHLDPAELRTLARLFQQRHLLAHTQGIVDEEYVARSGDRSYRVGQHLVIRAAVVREGLDLIEKLAAGMVADVSS